MLAIILIDYNSIRMTLDYIKQFIHGSTKTSGLHFIIIDNYEESKAEKLLVEEFQDYSKVECEVGTLLMIHYSDVEIVYHYTGENLGFARGNNRGFKIQKELYSDDVVLFSNSDIKLPNSFDIDVIIQLFADHPDVAVIGPEVTKIDGIKQNPHKKVSAWNRLIGYYWQMLIPFIEVKGDYDYSDKSKICYWVSACFMFVSADKFIEAQGFDERTFLYGEEMILAERLAKHGYKEFYYKDFSIIHETGGIIKKNSSRERSEKMCFDSLCYYYSQYRSTRKIIIWIARMNFNICKYLLRLKYMIFKK